MDPSIAALASELEVLDRVGLVAQPQIDAGLVEGAGEQPSGGADERLTEHRLGGVLE